MLISKRLLLMFFRGWTGVEDAGGGDGVQRDNWVDSGARVETRGSVVCGRELPASDDRRNARLTGSTWQPTITGHARRRPRYYWRTATWTTGLMPGFHSNANANENRKKRKRLRWEPANHGCHCFDRAFLLASACVCCVKISIIVIFSTCQVTSLQMLSWAHDTPVEIQVSSYRRHLTI